MISDEPDEDADTLDDEAILEDFIADPPSKQTGALQTAADLPDWPSSTIKQVGLELDADTLTWFKSMHVNWRQQMRFVLRAWVVAHKQEQQLSLVPPTDTNRLLSSQ